MSVIVQLRWQWVLNEQNKWEADEAWELARHTLVTLIVLTLMDFFLNFLVTSLANIELE